MLLKFLIFCFAIAFTLAARFNRRLSTAIISTAVCFFAFIFSFVPTVQYFVVPVQSESTRATAQLTVGSGIVETVNAGNATLVVVSGFNTYDYMAFYVFLFLLIINIVDIYMLSIGMLRKKGGGEG